jgi:ATP-dependent Lon protease
MENQLSVDVAKLATAVKSANLPEELSLKIQGMLERLDRQAKYGGYSVEYEQIQRYISVVISLPWNTLSKDILDLGYARQALDKNHFGIQDVKDRFLEYLSVLILNEKNEHNYHAPILLLQGLVGTGKTTLATSLAEALGRKMVRIPFGGLSSALDLRGQSRAHPDAEPGLIVKALQRAGTRNPLILLDEIDRIADTAKGEIMGVLVELLDPGQNSSFTDHYIDYPFDLSQVMFVATCNNTTNISTAVMDRLEPITMPSYTDEEKIHIAKDYVLGREIKKAGLLPGTLTIDDAVWPKITRPLGFDAGIRTLERTVQGIVRKVARQMVEGKATKFYLNETNIKQFLPDY